MKSSLTIGLPRMVVEAGEKRVFLPEFVQYLTKVGLKVLLEEGYGSRLGYTFDDYRRGNEYVTRGTREEAFAQDFVLILRSPKREEYQKIAAHSCFVSMLHFTTRPARVKALADLGVRAISLDSIIDDYNIRRVENMRAVAWNGIEAGFNILENKWPGLMKPDGKPCQVLILGAGMVGKNAVEAATKLGNIERYNDHIANHGSGAAAISVGRAATQREDIARQLFSTTDLLVDATQRRDPSSPVVPNSWVEWLPEHAVIVDLAVDPYLPDNSPPVVRGVEGIPMGNLDKYIYYPDDPDWCNHIPDWVPTGNRRVTVSCYSWPGIHPEACMEHYARQLVPLFEILVKKPYDALSPAGSFFERALYRGTLKAFLESTLPA